MSPATWTLAALAVLVLIGLGLEALQRRTGIPDALVLLGIGIFARQAGWFDPSAMGGLIPVFTTCALVLLLFESAIDMRIEELKGAARPTLLLTVISFFLSAGVIAGVGLVFLRLPVLHALLLGAILGGTSTSVVVPLTRGLRMGPETRVTLTLESTLNDSLCVMGALSLLALAQGENANLAALTGGLVRDVFAALALGLVAGCAVTIALRALRPHRLPWMFLLAALFLVYALTERLTGHGGLGCLALGIVLGNAGTWFERRRAASGEDEEEEKDRAVVGLLEGDRGFIQESAFLVKLLFFVYLGASFELTDVTGLLGGALAATAVLLVARPLAVRASLPAGGVQRRDAMMAAVMAPKGLAAAVLATVPAQRGLPGGERLATVVAAAVVFSIVASSVLSWVAGRDGGVPGLRWLFERYSNSGGQEPEPPTTPVSVEPDPA